MPHFYRRSKVDANQKEIVAALRRIGTSVLSLSTIGDGCPDLLCSHQGRMMFLEVKRPGRPLSPQQVQWVSVWDPHCPIFVVESINDAIYAVTTEDIIPDVRDRRPLRRGVSRVRVESRDSAKSHQGEE